MTKLSSLGLRRCFNVTVLLGVGSLSYLLLPDDRSTSADLLIFGLAMTFAGLGLALGSHLVIQDDLRPGFAIIAGAAAGGLMGGVLFYVWFLLGALLANWLGLKAGEGVGFGMILFPPWIFFSGSFAIASRYLVSQFLGNRFALAVVAGAVGALVGDGVMTILVFKPFTVGPHYLHAPLAWTTGLGALVATGLAWAERKLPGP